MIKLQRDCTLFFAAHPFRFLNLVVIAAALSVPLARVTGRVATMPLQAEQLLGSMHEYAERYVSSVPDFICQQTTEQFQAGRKGDHWRQLDSLTSKLVFANGQEHRTLEAVNGRAPNALRIRRSPLTTEGEFAILISNVFGEKSQAEFEWKGWEDLKGQRVGVFAYRIARDNSTMRLSRSDLAQAVVAYHGMIYGEPMDGSVRRITSEADEIPVEVKTNRISTVIDYGPVTVGNAAYLLPSDATVEVTTNSGRIRNELHFRSYQKFQADSSIKFDEDAAPEAKPPAILPP